MKEQIRRTIAHIREWESRMWQSKNHKPMGAGAIAIELDSIATDLEIAIGDYPPTTNTPGPGRPVSPGSPVRPGVPPAGADGTETGERQWSACQLVDIPGIGIKFSQFRTGTYFKFVAGWHNAKTKQAHVYEVTVEPCCAVFNKEVSHWRARAERDGSEVFVMEGKSRRGVIEMALTAMRRYLIRGHRAAWRTWRYAENGQTATNSSCLSVPVRGSSGKEVSA